jgi:crossover junction endodeoxyribonuclease RuvC
VLILGLDPGSVRCGYGMVEANGIKYRYVEAGVLHAPQAWDTYRRLAEIGRSLEEVLDQRPPDVVALEKGFVSVQKGHLQQGALVSAAARGVVGYIAARRGLSVVEYANNTVKSNAAGHGRASKEMVGKIVTARLGLMKVPPEDAGDALAIALCHATMVQGEIVAARTV